MQSNGEKIVLAVATLLVASLLGCDSKERKNSNSTSLPSNIKTLFEDRCVKCHSGATAPAGFNFVTSQSQMISAGLISPGDPENSVLFQKLSATPPSGDRMPKGGPYLSSDELMMISDWITNANVTPSLGVTTPANNSNITSSNNSATFTVTGTCNVSGSTISLKVNDVAVGTSVTCSEQVFSTTIDTTTTPFNDGAVNTLAVRMVKSNLGVDMTVTVSVLKNTNAISLAITSPQPPSETVFRAVTGDDTSYITSVTNSATYAVTGSCNRLGRTVTIAINGVDKNTTTCNGTTFTSSFDSTILTDAATHAVKATMIDTDSTSATNTVYVYKYIATRAVAFSDVRKILTYPLVGFDNTTNVKACIECHYLKTGSTAGSGTFTLGYWNGFQSGGGIPTVSNTERDNFTFRIANNSNAQVLGFTIVNDSTAATNSIRNRIVRGNPGQSFLYNKLIQGTTISVPHLLSDGTGPKVSGGTSGTPILSGRMPNTTSTGASGTGAIYLDAATNAPITANGTEVNATMIYNWILQGARTDN